MRAWIVILMGLVTFGCGAEVAKLSLRDPRLPVEARRWLADTEDEVAVARAEVDDARVNLERVKSYRREMRDNDPFPKSDGPSPEKTRDIFERYADERVELREMELDGALISLELSVARLTQVRAETAIRYDLAVYEMEEIVETVNLLKQEVGKNQKRVERQRALVEKTADELWTTYGKYVADGGKTNAFWGLRSAGGL